MQGTQLTKLFKSYETLNLIVDALVTGIAVDSRRVKPGDLFFATSDKNDGHQFIPEAIKNGAIAVAGTKEISDLNVPYIRVEDTRNAMAHVSAVFYGFPAKEITLIGVTGTDGKTTTVNYIFSILKAAGIKAGMISTVNAVIGEEELATGLHVTTPEVFEVQAYLRRMVKAGLTHAVLEATSHGLAARRLLGKDFDIAVVTNITHEHLNDHGSYEAYRQAKGLLFAGLGKGEGKLNQITPVAVINREDDFSYAYLENITDAKKVRYGLPGRAEVYATEIVNRPDMLGYTAHGPGFEFQVESQIIGEFNVWNSLAAICATVVGLGVKPEFAQEGIKNLPGVQGRMELVSMGQNFLAMVDFAHTPFALEAALEAGHKLTDGRVIAIFGSAGLRDKQKRRMMAEVAVQYADLTILTAEDPRTESLNGILEEMAGGAVSKGGVEGETFLRIPDRGKAIQFALDQAQIGDLVMILGKGHEQSMCFIDTEYPWDDKVALIAALGEYLGLETEAQMPYLPTSDENIEKYIP